MENARLLSLLEERSSGNTTRPLSSLKLMDEQEQELYIMLKMYHRPAGVFGVSDVIYPSEDCHRVLLSYAAGWAWLHSAISPLAIENMKSEYTEMNIHESSLSTSNAAWLALYFSCLTTGITFADENLVLKAGISNDDIPLLRNYWYNAALYFLDQANFLRVLNIRNVQTIAVLVSVFVNFGDFNLYYNLLGCAVRIGESLGINNDYTYFAGILPDLQSQRRLWWSLVILDWLNFPLGQPCIRDHDFMVEIPIAGSSSAFDMDDDSTHYQTIMARMAQVLYRFSSDLANTPPGRLNLTHAVEKADNHLANLIVDLPPYFQILEPNGAPIEENDAKQTRHFNQRQHFSVVLSYYRVVINRTSMTHSPSLSEDRSTLICLNSAHDIVRACHALDGRGQLVPVW